MVVCVFESMAGSELLVMDGWYRVILDLNLFCYLLLGGRKMDCLLCNKPQKNTNWKDKINLCEQKKYLYLNYKPKTMFTCKAHNISVRDKMTH